MGELGALFNPGMRHELEERRSKAARREEEGNARDGDLKIDLASGVAVINIPSEDDDAGDAEASTDADEAAAATSVAQESSAQESSAQESPDQESPAQESSGQESSSDLADGPGNGAGSSEAGAAEGPQPEALRPRGKRGLSSSSRR